MTRSKSDGSMPRDCAITWRAVDSIVNPRSKSVSDSTGRETSRT